MYDWNDLRHFLAVAREGSTLAAAQALGVNQSTVQRRLLALEQAVGQRLVERRSSGYRLTDLGQEMLSYAEGVEQAALAFDRQLLARGDSDLQGTIRVTCPETIGYRLAKGSLLKEFQAEYPGLKLDIVMSDRHLDLAKDEADVAIRVGQQPDESLIGRKIASVGWAVYASPSYVARCGQPASVDEIERHPVIEFGQVVSHLPAAQWLRRVAPAAEIAARSASVPGVVLAAKSGVGLALLPMPLGEQDDDLVRLLGPIPELAADCYVLVHPDLQRVPRIRAFLDFVTAELGRFRQCVTGR